MYAPLPESLTIKQSAIHGLGLFAICDIATSVVLGISHIEDNRFENDHIRTPLGGFYNHSENPNCHIIKQAGLLYLETIRPIKDGEEITSRYILYTPP